MKNLFLSVLLFLSITAAAQEAPNKAIQISEHHTIQWQKLRATITLTFTNVSDTAYHNFVIVYYWKDANGKRLPPGGIKNQFSLTVYPHTSTTWNPETFRCPANCRDVEVVFVSQQRVK